LTTSSHKKQDHLLKMKTIAVMSYSQPDYHSPVRHQWLIKTDTVIAISITFPNTALIH